MTSTKPHHQTGTTRSLPSGTKSWYTSANPFEQQFGYHRAVRRGPFIFVSGTTALKETVSSKTQSSSSTQHEHVPTKKQGPPYYQHYRQELVFESDAAATQEQKDADSKVHHPTSAKLQAQIAMERCVDAVVKLGGRREDVVRVKMFVSRHEDCSDVGAAFRECFGSQSERTDHDTNEIALGGSGFQPESVSEVGATATMIVVQDGFVDPDILVEVEVDAVVL